MAEILAAFDLCKTYRRGDNEVSAIRNISFVLEAGKFCALMGPSGCGKSTLLNIVGLVDTPSRGGLEIAGERADFSNEALLVSMRRRSLGYVFQYFNLLPTLTALENVMLPLLLLGTASREAKDRAQTTLDRVSLATKLNALPGTLSGGEMQRVAVARAIVHRPRLVLADEPTGNLDSSSGATVLDLLSSLADEGTSVLMATHSEAAAARCSHVLRLRDGELVS